MIALDVDVRDAALAHVLSIEKEEAIGQRTFITPGYFTAFDTLRVLQKHFPELKVAQIPAGYDNKNELDSKSRFENHLTNKQSGIKYYSSEQTLVNTYKSLIEQSKKW